MSGASVTSTPSRGSAARRWLRIGAGWVVAAAFVWLAFRRVSFAEVMTAVRTARPLPLGIALLALAAGFTVRIIRWWWMLRVLQPGLPLRACARPFLASMALNNTLPLRVGDVMRAVGFRSTLRASPMAVVGTLLVERLLDVVMLRALFFAGLLLVDGAVIPDRFLAGGAVVGLVATTMLLALILAPASLQRFAGWLLHHAPLGGGALRARALGLSNQFFASLAVTRPAHRVLVLLGLSALAWTLEGTTYACVAWSLSVGGSPAGPWFALATGTLATMIPSSPGYVGTFDYFAVLGLMAFGATRVAALGFALLVHLLLWLPVTVVGSACLLALPARRRAPVPMPEVGTDRAA